MAGWIRFRARRKRPIKPLILKKEISTTWTEITEFADNHGSIESWAIWSITTGLEFSFAFSTSEQTDAQELTFTSHTEDTDPPNLYLRGNTTGDVLIEIWREALED